jgi:hypothetical protein
VYSDEIKTIAKINLRRFISSGKSYPQKRNVRLFYKDILTVWVLRIFNFSLVIMNFYGYENIWSIQKKAEKRTDMFCLDCPLRFAFPDTEPYYSL